MDKNGRVDCVHRVEFNFGGPRKGFFLPFPPQLNPQSPFSRSRTQSMRLRLAFGVIVRLFLPLIHGIGRRWQILRSLKLRSYHANRSLFTSLFAHAANTVSMSLSSVQGESIKNAQSFPSLIKVIQSILFDFFSCSSYRSVVEENHL